MTACLKCLEQYFIYSKYIINIGYCSMIIISPEERELTKFQYEIPTRTV